jgi:hypothetical protein
MLGAKMIHCTDVVLNPSASEGGNRNRVTMVFSTVCYTILFTSIARKLNTLPKKTFLILSYKNKCSRCSQVPISQYRDTETRSIL